MPNIKRLYLFLLKTFLPVLAMVFLVCLFIIMMQFLWRMIDEFVGKGLGLGVIVEFFFYASLTFVPMTLPLGVLLASLMTFGNLGEKLELIAMKAAGVSLFQIMKPLIVTIVFVSILAFYFQNVISPMGEVKLYTLLYSIRDKSPEVEIPVGTFYDQLEGYSIFVDNKDSKTGMLYGVMIYNYSNGFEKAEILVADSGKMRTTEDKLSLLLTLYSGESFSNGEKQFSSHGNDFYVREAFSMKETVIDFDANFKRGSEERLQKSYLAKNTKELYTTADSLQKELDSVNSTRADRVVSEGFLLPPKKNTYAQHNKKADSIKATLSPTATTAPPKEILVDLDSIYERMNPEKYTAILQTTKEKIERIERNADFNISVAKEKEFLINRHQLELHRKFTLSLACLVFFFIGAPLGAIIGKGGFGSSATISVLFFVLYYFIDHSGENMARTGALTPAEGMWLSTIILLPLGIYLTYKAVSDSMISASSFSFSSIKNLFKHPVREFEYSDTSLMPPEREEIAEKVETLLSKCSLLLDAPKWHLIQQYKDFWLGDYKHLDELDGCLEHQLIPLLRECRDKEILSIAPQFPVFQMERCKPPFENARREVRIVLGAIIPLGLLFFLYSLWGKRILRKDMTQTSVLCQELLKITGRE